MQVSIRQLYLQAWILGFDGSLSWLLRAAKASHPDDVRFNLFHAKAAILDHPMAPWYGTDLLAGIEKASAEAVHRNNRRHLATRGEGR